MGNRRQSLTLIVPTVPDFRNFYYARMGAFSLSTHSIRYIAEQDVIDYEDKQDTAGVHYRDFVESMGLKFPKKEAPHSISYPYFAHASSLPNAFYVDIRRAYQQIACAFGMDVWFKEGKSVGYGMVTPSTQLFEISKIARGLLVSGHYEKSSYTEWKNGKLTYIKFPNASYAPFLQYAIHRTLHAILNKLRPFIYYAHTDGIICNHRMIDRVDKILRNEGFDYAIKHEGECTIKTTGCYRIGTHETATFRAIGGHQSTDYILNDEHDDWWLKAYQKGRAINRANILASYSSGA